MKVSVIIPTFRRPQSLANCLEGLRLQERPADEILIVTTAIDTETPKSLAAWKHLSTLKVLEVTVTGAVAQFNAGLPLLTGDIIVMTDDDAVPHRDWLARIEQHFLAAPDLGGVGGRDFVYEHGRLLEGKAPHVGTVLWFGRVTGNHHIGSTMFRDVDVLKGVNMAYRATAIRGQLFDTDLRGRGSQTCQDMAFSMQVKKRGWRLLYDPLVAVDHFPAVRFDDDQRGAPTQQALEDTSFNFYLTLLRHMRPGFRRGMALLWARSVGVRATPGWGRAFLARLRGEQATLQRRHLAKRAWAAARHEAGSSST